ncbi:MAG: pyruvate kinase [Bacteroides sp. SM23_62]|nr:MAG: pyruvate kinase [Bacteroides sp. SM23_62]
MNQLKFREERSHTKVIATLGPASSSRQVLEKLFEEGIDVCRLNFSHGSHEDHLKTINLIKKINAENNATVAILADLQGPKLRIGDMVNNGVELMDGSTFSFVNEPCVGDARKAYMSYAKLPADVKIGEKILVDDGKIQLEVTGTNRKDEVTMKVISGGILSSKKGVNLPDTQISLPSLTEKDISDARFALSQEIDWIALSFVRSVTDLLELKELIKQSKFPMARVVAKIEKPEALKEIDQIIDMADAVMVARGDLGVEVPFDQVPLIQKNLVAKCIVKSKPVIIATQMMESMISNFRPTRAEANDVGNAVLDGADALMLSGETSVGKYPVQVVRSMQQIIDATEKGYDYFRSNPPREFSRTYLSDSICFSACKMAEQTLAKAIITFTHSGYTAYRIASHRPKANIFAFTDNKRIINKLSLVWGVRAYFSETFNSIDEAINRSIERLFEMNLIQEEDVVIHVGSTPVLERGRTNMIKLSYV